MLLQPALLDHPFLVPPSGVRLRELSTRPPEGTPDDDTLKDELAAQVDALADLQRVLFADSRYAVLAVFQAMDAAGKDSTIRKVFSGVNPAGFRVHSFRAPSELERSHDFLWRCASRVPERGRIGIFNRSHYEEVLAVRVHPEYLRGQRLPHLDPDTIWAERFDSIRDWEKHLARNGTVVVKFFLNVSLEEQKRRFLRRIERPDKNWKFRLDDLRDRARWDAFQHAYEEAICATSTHEAPWYAIPADNKPFMRREVARIMVDTLKQLDLAFPTVTREQREELALGREQLLDERHSGARS
jgi:PPK2 family polyphosphate:nucleotide phosphotransferase